MKTGKYMENKVIENDMENKSTDRILWIDTAKGIGVILVILGHLLYQSNCPMLNQAIYSFHMPMFFILSGYVWKRSNVSILTFIKKKLLRLTVPAFLCSIICLLIFWNDTAHDKIFIIKNLLYYDGLIDWNAPAWFFFVLFEVVIFERITRINEKNLYLQSLICFAVFIVGFFIYHYKINLRFGLERAVLALGFYVLGNILSKLKSQKYTFEVFIAGVGIWLMFGIVLNNKVSMYGFSLGHYWYFVISGISGSIAFFILCSKITKVNRLINFLGKNTIFIICTHYIFVKKIIVETATHLNLCYTDKYMWFAVSCTILVCFLYCAITFFINKYIPLLNGRHRI